MLEREGKGGIRARWNANSSLACLPRARLFFLTPITSKLLLRRLREFPPSAMLFSSLLLLFTVCKLIFNLHRNASELLEEREHIYLSEQANWRRWETSYSSRQLLCQGRISYLMYRNGEQRRIYIHSVSSFVVIYSLRYCFTPQVLRDSFIGENSKTCMVRFDCGWSFRDLDQSP